MTFDATPSDANPQDAAATERRMLAELEAITKTAEFERAPVMRRLLAFLVHTTLRGQGDELKAYTVAVEGLGRDPDFDAGSDSYPRVQVGRLRKMLDAHYAANPASGGERLIIKSGGYRVDLGRPAAAAEDAAPGTVVPVASDRSAQVQPPARHSGPVWAIGGALALLAFAILAWALWPRTESMPRRTLAQAPVLELAPISTSGGSDAVALARALETLLDDALHRSWLIRAREARPAARAADPSALDAPVYRLNGHVDTTGALGGRHLSVSLRNARTGDHIWSQTLLLPTSGVVLDEAVRPMISSLIRPFGVIGTDQRHLTPEPRGPGYACLLAFDAYFRYREVVMRKPVEDCVAATIAAEPSAPAFAAASALSFDPNSGGDTPAARARGATYARRAVAIDPYSGEAQVADARAAFIAGECTRGRAIVDRAAALNRYNPEAIGLLGYMLYQCSDPAAVALLRTAIALDPDVPIFYRIALMLALIEAGGTAEALQVADTTRPSGLGMAGQYHLVRTIAIAARGDQAGARREWRLVTQRSGQEGLGPDRVLSRFIWSPPHRAKVIRYLVSSGVISAP